jgi:6-pyruvoyltetrahydropterin/6-carboxytetrahydropterin synthase
VATATIAKTFTFQAAHLLPNHDGKCAQLHGHSYRVDVHARGPINGPTGKPDEGMVLDFARIAAAWRLVEPHLDHRFLNDVLDFPTTAENLASYLLTRLHDAQPAVCSVRVWETATSWAEVSLP